MDKLKAIAWFFTGLSYVLILLFARTLFLGRINPHNSDDILASTIFMGMILGVFEFGRMLHEKNERREY